jgi:hypothetical protein
VGCYNSIIIDAPIDKVWSTIRDFQDTSWAKGVVESHTHVGDLPGSQVGSQRKLNDLFEETLVALDDKNRTFSYSIDECKGTPIEKGKVTNYVGTVRLCPLTDGDKTFFEWTSTWDWSEGGVAEFCNPIYQALLKAAQTNITR